MTGSRAVPVLDAFGDGEDHAGQKFDGLLSPNLNVARARLRHENLAGAAVNVPEGVRAVDERDVRDVD